MKVSIKFKYMSCFCRSDCGASRRLCLWLRRAICVVAASLAGVAASAFDFEVDGICYIIVGGTEAQVTAKEGGYEGSVTIPASVSHDFEPFPVTSIGNYAFLDCVSLTAVAIPASVTFIGDCAFGGCVCLGSVTVESASPATITLGETVFEDVPEATCTLHVPKGSGELYRNAPQWCVFPVQEDAPTGAAEVTADGAMARAVYYDLTGRRVAHPGAGIYIRDGRKEYVR